MKYLLYCHLANLPEALERHVLTVVLQIHAGLELGHNHRNLHHAKLGDGED